MGVVCFSGTLVNFYRLPFIMSNRVKTIHQKEKDFTVKGCNTVSDFLKVQCMEEERHVCLPGKLRKHAGCETTEVSTVFWMCTAS
jgi:hypothetical protein